MKTIKKLFLYGISTIIMAGFFGLAVHAQTPPVTNPNPTPSNTNCPSPCVTPAATSNANAPLNIHLQNPLSSVSTIPDAINKILSIVIRIALPIIILMFIWAGLMFIFSRGNPTKVTIAKNMFFYTIIGTLLILGAWVITNAIIGTVNTITG